MTDITKEELHKLIDGLNMKLINCGENLIGDYTNTEIPLKFSLINLLEECQKEPKLLEKLIQYCKSNGLTEYSYSEYKGSHAYNNTFKIYGISIDISKTHFNILVRYEPNEIICNTHEQVFDALKLFEKWMEE
jgi:hypothetical protein